MSVNIDAIRSGTYKLKPNEERIETDDTIWIKPKSYKLDKSSIKEKHRKIQEGEKPKEYRNISISESSPAKAFSGEGLVYKFNNEYMPLRKAYQNLHRIHKGDKENKIVQEYLKKDRAFKEFFNKGYLKLDKGKVISDINKIKKDMSSIEGNLKAAELLEGEKSVLNARKILNDMSNYGDIEDIKFDVSSIFRDSSGHEIGRRYKGKKVKDKKTGKLVDADKSAHGLGSAVDISFVNIGGKRVSWKDFAEKHTDKYRKFIRAMLDRGYRYINEKSRNHGHFSVNNKYAGRVSNRPEADGLVYDSMNKLYVPFLEDVGL